MLLVAHATHVESTEPRAQGVPLRILRTEPECSPRADMRASVGRFLAATLDRLGVSRRGFASRIGVRETIVRRMCDGSVGIDIADAIAGGRAGRELLEAALAENRARSLQHNVSHVSDSAPVM